MFRICAAILPVYISLLPAASPLPPTRARLALYADAFLQRGINLTTQETLVQRTYRIPVHARFAIGEAATPLTARFVTHEVVSQYGIGPLRGDSTGKLLEMRELLSMDGAAIQTPEKARRALAGDIGAGETQIRKKMLETFTRLGLLDVATDYGLILLAFTTRGQNSIEFEEAGEEWVGTDEADVLHWRQTFGGALEFRGRKTERRALHGALWIRKSDGLPLRISASFEHDEAKHSLRDDASVDFVLGRIGCVTPVSVVHRHLIDGVVLTENLYTYQPFRLFTTDTTIRYGESKEEK